MQNIGGTSSSFECWPSGLQWIGRNVPMYCAMHALCVEPMYATTYATSVHDNCLLWKGRVQLRSNKIV